MSLERGIHQRWKENYLLTRRVPNQRFITGRAAHLVRDGNGSWVVLKLIPEHENTRTSSSGILGSVLCEFEIHAPSLDEAQAIGTETLRCFHRADFPFQGGRTMDMKLVKQSGESDEPHGWKQSMCFRVRIEIDDA